MYLGVRCLNLCWNMLRSMAEHIIYRMLRVVFLPNLLLFLLGIRRFFVRSVEALCHCRLIEAVEMNTSKNEMLPNTPKNNQHNSFFRKVVQHREKKMQFKYKRKWIFIIIFISQAMIHGCVYGGTYNATHRSRENWKEFRREKRGVILEFERNGMYGMAWLRWTLTPFWWGDSR